MTTLLIATRNAHKVGEIRAILGARFHFLTLNDFPGAPKVVEDANTFAGNATKKAVELAKCLNGKRSTCSGGSIVPPGVNVGTKAPHSLAIFGGEGLGVGASPSLKQGVYKAYSTPTFVLADDSGLEVDALNGAPGVHSARFAALDKDENSPDADNNAKLLRLLKDVPLEKRTGRFRCVIALVPVPEKKIESASPVCYADEFETQLFDGTCEGRIQLIPHGAGGFGYDPLFVPDGFTQSFTELGEDVKNKLSHRAKALAKLKKFLGAS